jgi:hypothetical protein
MRRMLVTENIELHLSHATPMQEKVISWMLHIAFDRVKIAIIANRC